jgi:N-acetylglucosamine-6-phosphate deacetylase
MKLTLALYAWLFSYLFAGPQNMIQKITALDYRDGDPICIEIANGMIDRITPLTTPLSDDSLYVAPGLIDSQVNGYLSIDFTQENLTTDAVHTVTRALWAQGVTSYLPTLITAPVERLATNLHILAQALHDPETGQCIPGFHLEGPYISPLDGFRGAHNKDDVKNPDWDEFAKLYQAADGKILYVTLAPETDGAMDFTSHCTAKGIVVGLGHHNATAQQVHEAAGAGARISTHLGNGCANMIHRHQNPLWPQLADDRLMISLIVDGIHLLPDEVKTFYKVKGADKTILISDMTKLAGMPPGDYEWDGKQVVLTPEGMIKYPEQNVLAGASLPVRIGVENMMKFTQCSLAEAVNMASVNPAQLFGLNDRGELLPGKRADLILFKIKNGHLEIRQTILNGRVVFNVDPE